MGELKYVLWLGSFVSTSGEVDEVGFSQREDTIWFPRE